MKDSPINGTSAHTAACLPTACPVVSSQCLPTFPSAECRDGPSARLCPRANRLPAGARPDRARAGKTAKRRLWPPPRRRSTQAGCDLVARNLIAEILNSRTPRRHDPAHGWPLHSRRVPERAAPKDIQSGRHTGPEQGRRSPRMTRPEIGHRHRTDRCPVAAADPPLFPRADS